MRYDLMGNESGSEYWARENTENWWPEGQLAHLDSLLYVSTISVDPIASTVTQTYMDCG